MPNKIKNQNLCITAMLLLLPLSTHAKSSKHISVGTTRATLRSEDGKSGWGEYMGIGLEYARPSTVGPHGFAARGQSPSEANKLEYLAKISAISFPF